MQFETAMPVYAGVETRNRVLVSAELIAYAALLVFAVLMRVANLDTVPLMPSETHNALAAWRAVSPNAPGFDLTPSSAIIFDAQSVGFALLGGTEFAARIATVLAGVVVMLLPVLFRPLLGRTTAFLTSVMLTFSPVLLVASRTSSADVWALLFAGSSLWGYWQALRTGQQGYAIFAVASFAALLFLTGAGGVALALILIIAGLIALISRERTDPLEDAPQMDLLAPLRRSLGLSLVVAALVVFALATGFLLYPSGLSSVGESFGNAIRAVVQPQGIVGYAVLVALFYEPFLWVLAIAGLAARRYRITTLDRFLVVWVIIGGLLSLVFVDGDAGHALWITVPLAILAARGLELALAPDVSTIFEPAPSWARWLVATCAVGVFCVFTLAFQSVGRSLVQSADGTLAAANFEPASGILVLIAVLFLLIGYFLFASLWGSGASWQGLGIGLAIFGAVTSLGAGWNVAVDNADNPAIFWHAAATHDDTALMRQTLFDVSLRQTRGFPTLPVTVMAPQDGIVAWVLRDYDNTEYIDDVGDAVGKEVVVLPASIAEPNLGSSYVGQDFVVERSWDIGTMSAIDIPGWWTQQKTRTPWTGESRYNLWLRQDIYNGTSAGSGAG